MLFNTLIQRLRHALNGLRYAIISDKSFRQQLHLGLITISISLIIFFPLTIYDTLFIFLAWFLILITEMQNSAIEAALDRLHPEIHDSIKQSKDLAAGSVLLAGVFLVLVITSLLTVRFILPYFGIL